MAVLLVGAGVSPGLHADAAPPGMPPVTLHRPDLPVYPRNFAVAESPDGQVWLGNNDGVLEFDGENWRLWRLPNRELVRSLAVDERGRVYVGGYNAFGYLQRDEGGALRYHGLESAFADRLGGREFADIWDLVIAPECVYFKALNDVFCWRPEDGATWHWTHPDRFGALAHLSGETWLQFRGEGLRRRSGEDWEAMPASAGLGQLMYGLLPVSGGDRLGFGADRQWWRIGPDGSARSVSLPAPMPSPGGLQFGLARYDGTLVFASGDGELFELQTDLSAARRFRVAHEFLAGVAESRSGGLLVAADSGFYHLRWPSSWTMLSAEDGLHSSLAATATWASEMWLLGSAGAQRLLGAGNGSAIGPVQWEGAGLNALLPLDRERALLAGARRLHLAEADGARRALSEEYIYPRLLQRSRVVEHRVLVGTEFGLRHVDLSGPEPIISAKGDVDLAVRVNSLVEREDGSVIAGSDRHGLWQYRLEAGDARWRAKRLDGELAIRTGPVAMLAVAGLPGGEMLASTSEGFWQGTPEQGFRQVDLDGLEALRDEEEFLRFVVEGEAPRWAFSHYRVLEKSAQGWREHALGALRRGAILDARMEDGRLLVVSDQALLIHEPGEAPVAPGPVSVQLREVWVEEADGVRRHLPLAPEQPPQVVLSGGATFFRFAALDLDQPEGTRYRGRLRGEEEDFSAWEAASSYTYFGLSPGRYTLEVQARDAAGRIAEMRPYPLVVLPRWFEATWFVVLAAAVLLLAVAGVLRSLSRRRIRRIWRQNAALEQQVSERTLELAEANRRLRTMADLDGLTGIANRRRLDEYLPMAWERCAQRDRPLSVLLVDVDRFKQFNDQHGHLAGDELIRRIADLLRKGLRRSEDLVARYGGEEFLIVLPGATRGVATELAGTLRADAERELGGVTLSIGVATAIPGLDAELNMLIERADAALYRAKAAGRNRVEVDVGA